MSAIDWLIMTVPFAAVLGLAIYARRYARDAVDFLAAGRVAGRYVISVGDVAASLSVITIVANCEQTYRAGSAMSFWGILPTLLGMFLSLSGYCVYRWRATRALSFGQFLEMRYNRTFRVFCAVLRNFTEMVANAIGPAIAANFFVYFFGLPHTVNVFGHAVPTFALIVGVCLVFALLAVWPAGRISLLVTDTVQGMLSYPIFAIVAAWIFFKFDWKTTMEPVMMNRVPGESFLNPFDIDKLRDFNLFALGVWLMSTVLQRASWFGNDTSSAGRTPHEQKMAGVLGTWRNGYAYTMIGLVTLLVITVMNHGRYVLPGEHGGFSSHVTRVALVNKVAAETVPDPAVRGRIAAALDALPARLQDEPLSQLRNNDTPYIDAARDIINANIPETLKVEAAAVAAGGRAPSPELAAVQGANAKQAQKLRTLYGQMMMPVVLRQILPTCVIGLFGLLMLMLLVSTDDSRIFNAAATWIQDVVLPFRKTPPDSRSHIAMLRWSSAAVAAFFFVVAVFFSQLDFINLFTQILCAVWLGGGGTVMVFGLYSRFGNTAGAWCSIVFGSGFSLFGLVTQRVWASHVVPWLSLRGWTEDVFRFFADLSRPFNPYVDWSFGFNSGESTLEQALQLFREKLFINSTEIYGLSMVLSIAAYCLGSWVARRFFGVKRYNLDKMLHRGKWATGGTGETGRTGESQASPVAPVPQVTPVPTEKPPALAKRLLSRLVGINDEYTRGDRIIAWASFFYMFVWRIGIATIGVMFWNMARPFPAEWWGGYYYVMTLCIPMVLGMVCTVWFIWGGIRDLIRLFRDLGARVRDASDNGFVAR
ncbi:MAG: sodium:panthothenate symporter [Kiritimatiellae bacterium]|nr:sodium:panthothenate symporter [Kiritimatiellia bacterium]